MKESSPSFSSEAQRDSSQFETISCELKDKAAVCVPACPSYVISKDVIARYQKEQLVETESVQFQGVLQEMLPFPFV